MRSKISLKRSLFIVGIAAIAFYVIILFLAPAFHNRLSYAKTTPQAGDQISQAPIEVSPIVPAAVAPQIVSATPVRLKIPSIDLDAAIEQVGKKANGEMDVPKDPADVAWYNLSPSPGEIGSAVIAGHYGTLKSGKGSIFDNLKKLNIGDQIFIEDDKGATITFVVRKERSYEADADASGVFVSNDGKAHLNLVTCQNWDEISKSYSKRLVIFTDKV